jgi:hypothetical protein
MRMILLGLMKYKLDLDAVQEAYRIDKRGTELQKALVMEMARNCLYKQSFDDHRDELECLCMDKVAGFYPDVAAALVDEMDQAGSPLGIDDFLVDESAVVYELPYGDDDMRLDFIPQPILDSWEDEDSHEDESCTDG